MPFKNRIFLIILVIVIVALAAVLLAPIAVSNGVRLWVWWFARQEGFVATIDKVDAPFAPTEAQGVAARARLVPPPTDLAADMARRAAACRRRRFSRPC